MTLPLDARPRLAPKVKLRLDRKTGQHMLLYPERGMMLNATGTAIVQLCTGDLPIAEIVAKLGEPHPPEARPQITAEILAFMSSLADRGLLKLEPPA